MTPPDGTAGVSHAEALRKIDRLTRINAALIHRVERGMGHQGSAFSLFQTAIALDAEVRARTAEQKATLEQLARTNYELVQARDLAERANRSRTAFFTAAGHDLLQPLQAARLMLSTLSDMEVEDGARKLVEQIEQALSGVDELLHMILDLSKLDAGALQPVFQAVAIAEIFASLRVALGPLAQRKGLSLDFRATALCIRSDPMMLRRMVQNLVGNAIRYTDRGGILVVARRRTEGIRIDVWDTGAGILAAERDRIFDEFERGSASRLTGAIGLGLGLSIVKRMADAMGHAVGLRSRPGHGSCFTITAPEALLETARPPRRTDAPIDAGRLPARVVVVENDAAVLAAVTGLLRRWGCAVASARALGQAEALLEAPPPDLVLADYHLDDGDCGLSAVTRFRAAWGEALPVIVITADHSQATLDDIRRQACESLLKPIKPAEMRALMAHLISR